ncbi:pentapeptide repeat-containing protein, partial [Chamaesiphon sp. VAR_48_metabat_403]|uniref:pentapeptide repeat-containing protein n=1 Tax=Chamaesiphon sp. VAR_48_metabat_403 TaxID=2964700 RepID=UPI0037C0A7B0
MAEITAKELLARYAAGERDFQGVILSGIVLNCSPKGIVNLEGVNFAGTIFRQIRMGQYWHSNVTIGSKFINCNFSHSKWEFCQMPALIGCNLQYSVMKGCRYKPSFVDCNWRYGQIIGATLNDMIFERCDLSRGEWNFDAPYLTVENEWEQRGFFSFRYIDTIDIDGIFHSGIDCSWPRFD